MELNGTIRWANRVSPEKIRRLYESDARGLLDEELLQDVFTTIHLRCQSIREVDEGRAGNVTCQGCGAKIACSSGRGPQRKSVELICCQTCGWSVTWGRFYHSFHKKKLTGGGAAPFVKEFLERAPAARVPQAKMLMIDRLIHQFHTWRDTPTRPCAVNVIQGDCAAVLALLDNLAYGDTLKTDTAAEARGKFWRIREESRRSRL